MVLALCVNKGFPDCGRRPDGDKAIFGINIIFTAFVNNPDISICPGLRVRDNSIYLVALKRRRII